mmetsp:Transcript_5410/g.9705  ORF Transcript_5410/g.9705 Transcript_5410/m.9705 type:complete len:341 (-) Transcript_5410:213-1235(-)
MQLTMVFLILLLLLYANALQPVALLTGATGRTGQLVTNLMLDQGFRCNIFCRNEQRAREIFHGKSNIEFFQGELINHDDIQAAFDNAKKQHLSHVVYMAGGDNIDYKCVNYQAVAAFAEEAAKCETMRHFVVVSTAWATKPYSIASLLFNSMYIDTVPMASHYLGEQAVRKAASMNENLNYVVLRATGLNSDENYAKKYPDAVSMELTYQQGDNFDFFGIAGKPGMSRNQLANAIVSAVNVEGRYTVEVTGSGTVERTDSSVYERLIQDEAEVTLNAEDEIYDAHVVAVKRLKNTATTASLTGIALVGLFGWSQGLFLFFSFDAAIIFVWSVFFAKKQAL